MRTVIAVAIMVYGATGLTVRRPVLSVRVEGRYRHEKTDLTKEKDGWICETELIPKYPVIGEPFKNSSLKAVRSGVAEKRSCDTVTITDRTSATETVSRGCATDRAFSVLLAELARACGRN